MRDNLGVLLKDVNTSPMIRTPDVSDIPAIMNASYEALKTGGATPIEMLAVLEAVTLSLKSLISRYMYDWDSSMILRYGEGIDELYVRLEKAADEIIKNEDMTSGVGHLWPTFPIIQKLWVGMHEIISK